MPLYLGPPYPTCSLLATFLTFLLPYLHNTAFLPCCPSDCVTFCFTLPAKCCMLQSLPWPACLVTDRIDVVINCTPICVKIKSKLTNLMKITRIEGYNGKYGSNPQGIREISDDLFEFDQIELWIDGRNWGKWYFMKENFKTIPHNKKSSNLTLMSRTNWRSKWGKISENRKNEINENQDEIKLNY